MPQPELTSLWEAKPPSTWPQPPAEMTVTTLREIEACPRRWALMSAAYPTLWSGHGYPPRITLAALGGTVVHLALERITRAFVAAGCKSSSDPAAMQVMRTLGGYTTILNDCIHIVKTRALSNPRAARSADQISRSLRAQVADLRARTQALISTFRIDDERVVRPERAQLSPVGAVRTPLPPGAYSELELRVPSLGWKGRADLLVLTDSSCHLTDFKTGAPDETHKFQLQVYALLWNRDSELNPTGRCADRLTVAYSSGQREIAVPTGAQLQELEREMIARRDAALLAVSRTPPEARPTAENCGYCAVRHLCEEYWIWQSQTSQSRQVNGGFGDVEVTVSRRHGPASWDAEAETLARFPRGGSVLLRTSDDMQFRPGQRLRIVDAGLSVRADEEEPVVVTLGSFSEVYLVPYRPRG